RVRGAGRERQPARHPAGTTATRSGTGRPTTEPYATAASRTGRVGLLQRDEPRPAGADPVTPGCRGSPPGAGPGPAERPPGEHATHVGPHHAGPSVAAPGPARGYRPPGRRRPA